MSLCHKSEVDVLYEDIIANGIPDARWSVLRGIKGPSARNSDKDTSKQHLLPTGLSDVDVFPWLPSIESCSSSAQPKDDTQKGRILLFYKYRY